MVIYDDADEPEAYDDYYQERDTTMTSEDKAKEFLKVAKVYAKAPTKRNAGPLIAQMKELNALYVAEATFEAPSTPEPAPTETPEPVTA